MIQLTLQSADNQPAPDPKRPRPSETAQSRLGFFRRMWVLFFWVLLILGLVWSFGALWFDFPLDSFRQSAALLFIGVVLAIFDLSKSSGLGKYFVAALILVVALWWKSLEPSLNREWQPDVAELPWAEIQDDEVTLHNVRNFDYRSPTDFTPHWETRAVKLSQITGVDMFINYWGSPWMAHPIISFQFRDAPPLCFSIETRKEVGEKYSALGGLYRQFELYYVVADERDVIRLRTSIRPGETAYLYRTRMLPAQARERFLEYVTSINDLRHQARWYHALNANCTTAIRAQRSSQRRLPWDWRLIVNGKGDEMLYDRELIVTDGLPFSQLKEKALINTGAQEAADSPDFSKRIRENRPGFMPPLH